jgi:hypothetical protein
MPNLALPFPCFIKVTRKDAQKKNAKRKDSRAEEKEVKMRVQAHAVKVVCAGQNRNDEARTFPA